mmetsp:Transcript_49429/g.81327  ORF Transcript_49429/g.81327 Transcript_49429/m.81327 type:complete len:101 (-) Transcript_49429:573-875(-)
MDIPKLQQGTSDELLAHAKTTPPWNLAPALVCEEDRIDRQALQGVEGVQELPQPLLQLVSPGSLVEGHEGPAGRQGRCHVGPDWGQLQPTGSISLEQQRK